VGTGFNITPFTSTSSGESITGSGAWTTSDVEDGTAIVVLTEGAVGPPSDYIMVTYTGTGSTETITVKWVSDTDGVPLGIPAPPFGTTTEFLAETGGVQDVTNLLITSAGNVFPADITVQVQSDVVEGVPEPSTWAMMLLGFAGLGFAFRQSRRRVSFA
jgi:hypothetical protein